MKKLVLFLLLFAWTSKVYASEITDIENCWAKEYIEDAIINEVITGYEDNTFKPDNDITLAEYLKILTEQAKIKIYGKNIAWPDYYIEIARLYDFCDSVEILDYNKKITRNEVARITSNYINNKTKYKITKNFLDIDKEYKEDVLNLVSLGVITGYDDNTFRGENYITRAEAVVISKRAIDAKRMQSNNNISKEKKYLYTNIKTNNRDIEYEIKNSKLFITLKNKLYNGTFEIKNPKIINVINSLITNDSFTKVSYNPSTLTSSKIIISQGENEKYADILPDFIITYYEDESYNLRKNLCNESLSEYAYMKIEPIKLWRDYSEFLKGNYIDTYKGQRFLKALIIEFGEKEGTDIYEYIINITKKSYKKELYSYKKSETVKFGKYIVNYIFIEGVAELYISK